MNQNTPIRLKYFAWLRENIGKAEESHVLPQSVDSVDTLISWLIEQDANYAQAFENRETIKVAINQKHVEHNALLEGAYEIAFFPPMTGG